MITLNELEFLRESNNIEDEWTDMSLQDAILAWQYIKGQKLLSRSIILKTHELLMASRDTIDDIDKGNYRQGDVWIGGRLAKKWFYVPELTEAWIETVNNTVKLGRSKKNPVFTNDEFTKEHHVAFEAIHPFLDGNGRIGRILYNWERIQCGFPIKIIHVGKEQEQYYEWFN